MLTIILAVVLGVVLTFLSVNNNQTVQLNLVDNSYRFPLYIIISFSFLAGTLITSIIAMVDKTTDALDVRKKENNYKNALDTNEKLKNVITRLNNEILLLKKDNNELKTELRDKNFNQKKENIKDFFSKITHPGSTPPNSRVAA